jgi:hypothetical protein
MSHYTISMMHLSIVKITPTMKMLNMKIKFINLIYLHQIDFYFVKDVGKNSINITIHKLLNPT